MEYVVKRKIQETKKLLRDGKKSTDSIAEELGFCSSSYFQKQFKKYNSITVEKYRNQRAKGRSFPGKSSGKKLLSSNN